MSLIKRAQTEYNCIEAIVALVCLFPAEIFKYNDIVRKTSEIIANPEKFDTVLKCVDIKKYINESVKKETIFNDFIPFVKKSMTFDINPTNKSIKCVFLTGKLNTYDEIKSLNSRITRKESKGDVYIKYEDNSFVGISVKESVNATKSNYSVHKLLNNGSIDKWLTHVKITYLNSHGITCFNKQDRKRVNELFYPHRYETNLYFKILRSEIMNDTGLAKKLVDLLYCKNVHYDMYEMDGSSCCKLNRNINSATIKFYEHEPYYLKNSGKYRNAAKMFYRLEVEGKEYRVEIRWKGNIFSASPQFQIHEI